MLHVCSVHYLERVETSTNATLTCLNSDNPQKKHLGFLGVSMKDGETGTVLV